MYSLLMFAGSMCLLASMVLVPVIIVRLVKRKPAKKIVGAMFGSFFATPILVGLASVTEQGKLEEQKRQVEAAKSLTVSPEASAPVTAISPTATLRSEDRRMVDSASGRPGIVQAAALPPPAPELAKSVAAKLSTAESAMSKSKWEEAGSMLAAVRELMDSAPANEAEHADVVALRDRYARAKNKWDQLNAALFEDLYRAIMIDEFKEPRGLRPSDAAEWETKEAARRTRAIAKQFRVSSPYAERIYMEGPLLERMAKQAELEQEKDRERQRALAARCGAELRTNWSGEPVAVREHLNETLHDRRSLKDLSCNGPWLTAAHCWVTNCTYRAKNLMGAYMLTGQKFYVANDHVTRAEDL